MLAARPIEVALEFAEVIVGEDPQGGAAQSGAIDE